MEEKNNNTSFEITAEGEKYILGEEDNSIYIDVGAAEPALDFSMSGTNTIDLSSLTAGNISIGSGPYSIGAISGAGAQASYQFSSINTTGINWDSSNNTGEVVIKSDSNSPGIKLLATLNLWSEILGLPLVRDSKFNSPILDEIYADWVEAAKQGKIKQSKKFKEQFDIIEKLTKDEKKDNE